MSCWINIPHGIIPHVRIAIEVLWVRGVRHDGVRAEEASQFGREESCPVVIDSQSRHLALTGKQLISLHRAGREARLAVWIIPLLTDDIPAGIGHDTGRAEMVFEDVIQRAVDPHRSTGIIHGGFCHRAAGGFVHFVDSARRVNGLLSMRRYCFFTWCL